MRKIVSLFFVAAAVMTSAAAYAQKTSGNPIFEGDYADRSFETSARRNTNDSGN